VGSANLLQTLFREALVDRVNLWVCPVMIGQGKKLFPGGTATRFEQVRGGFLVERVTGIEPALSAWEADVLPLNYTRERGQSADLGSISNRTGPPDTYHCAIHDRRLFAVRIGTANRR
jgi:hypothetical protein